MAAETLELIKKEAGDTVKVVLKERLG